MIQIKNLFEYIFLIISLFFGGGTLMGIARIPDINRNPRDIPGAGGNNLGAIG